jgi:hypothetical protein
MPCEESAKVKGRAEVLLPPQEIISDGSRYSLPGAFADTPHMFEPGGGLTLSF